jgi:hypothetical protein
VSTELLPTTPGSQVIDRLTDLVSRAQRMRGLLAFWTLPADELGPNLPRVLANDGFLCLDIHRPTDIDRLDDLNRSGAPIYLYLYDLSGQTEQPGTIGLPPHLMHAKTLLFDMPDGTSMLWTGSHNGTLRALHGLNVEMSVLLTLDRSSTVYREAERFVEEVRARCDRFQSSLCGYYKWLQGDDSSTSIIEMEDSLDAPITQTTITLFGVKVSELSEMKTVDKDILVSLTSSRTGATRIYNATVAKTGHLGGVQFDPCRHAYRDGNALPVLQPHGPVPALLLKKSKYFVSLSLNALLPPNTVVLTPSQTRWNEVKDDDQIDALPARQRSMRRRDRDKPPKLRRAAPPEEYRASRRTLDIRRQRADRLIVKAVLSEEND